MKIKMHLVMPINWLEDRIKTFENKENWEEEREIFCEEMFWMPYSAVKEKINKLKQSWFKYIPSEWCDNIQEDWSCWWHKEL